MTEKALETITLHLPESLKRDLQDLALAEVIVYGRLAWRKDAKRNEEKRK